MKNQFHRDRVASKTNLRLDEEPPSRQDFNSFRTTFLNNFKKVPSRTKSPDFTILSETSRNFLQLHFPESSVNDWLDWKWQIKNSITSKHQLEKLIQLNDDEENFYAYTSDVLPLRITPYYASLIGQKDNSPLRKCVVPVEDEFFPHEGEAKDPLCEEHDSPLPNLVHRYPDRVLFIITDFCSAYCRYCTRSRMVAKDKHSHFGKAELEKAFEYIESHKSIRDVLLSGGDPLTLSDMHLHYILSRLRKIPHVEFIRIGTKVPVVLPQRITMTFVNMIRKFHPVWMSIHFTHPSEITPEVKEACARLADAGIPLGSQTVLLKNINDDAATMKMLMHQLLINRVRPYYLYQCDPITGSSHFRTPVSKGVEMIQELRGHTSGYAVPSYVIDAPGGGGKIPLLPDYYAGKEGTQVMLKNYEGKIYRYPDIP